jgi:hypothetical protein
MGASRSTVEALSTPALLAATREIVRTSQATEADLLVHLGEVDERKLYLTCAQPSMFAFCVNDLKFSDDAAYNRITVARAARRYPAILESIRSGEVHLFGMRLLAAHLTEENHRDIVKRAAGKTRREIEELVATLWPCPPAATIVRKVQQRAAVAGGGSVFPSGSPSAQVPLDAPSCATGSGSSAAHESRQVPLAAPACAAASGGSAPESERGPAPTVPSEHLAGGAATGAPPPLRRGEQSVVAPLSEDTFRVQFTATRSVRDKLRQAQDLLRNRVAPRDLNAIFGLALDALVEKVKKERFGVGRKPRHPRADAKPDSRHIPASIKRAVYERDDGRCTFTDSAGRRCTETGAPEFDHRKGFARTKAHRIEDIRLLCRAHNQQAADDMYGREFMKRARASRSTRSRTSPAAKQVSPRRPRPRGGSG